MRSDDIAEAVKELQYHSDMKALVWDGARGHRGEKVRNVGLATIKQPAYSPELNSCRASVRGGASVGGGQDIRGCRREDGIC